LNSAGARSYLYFTVFVSGMTTLAAEFAAPRLIGNVFGNSNMVWASIIGLSLLYLTLGYFVGGVWADRRPQAATMYQVLAWGAFTLGIVPYCANPVLHFAARSFADLQLAVLLGSFATVLILFSVPVTLLGTISPFAIRLAISDRNTAGATAGRMYALSTLGSFIGTFLPVLVTIPTIGTRNTFLLFSMLLLAVALTGLGLFGSRALLLRYAWMPVLLPAIAALTGGQAIKADAGQIYETESAYNYIQVAQVNGFTLLRLNEGMGIHSIYHPDILNYSSEWEQLLVGPFFYAHAAPGRVGRMAIVGLAAGTTARQATAVYGPIPIDGFEIDPEIVAVGRKYFAGDLPNLTVHIGDGRWNLEQSRDTYDIIAVDAYRVPCIPPHMTTREFFRICADRLRDTGVLGINVASVPGDRRLINGLATTLATVFPAVHLMDIPGSLNTIIFATRQPTSAAAFIDNLADFARRSDIHPLLLAAMRTTAANLQPGYETTQVFTDDRAPIEWIINNMLIHSALSGQLQELPNLTRDGGA